MRAVCYARVSSASQRERDTIASQMRDLPAFVAQRGWTLVKPVETYVDDGRSAKAGKLDKRTGLTNMLRDAAAGTFDVVVIASIDRLTRAEDLAERGMILGALQHAGVHVAEQGGEIMDLSSDHGDMMASLRAYLAAAENRRKSKAVRAGKLTAAQRGRKVGRGPYGLLYDRATGAWSIDPVRGPIVAEVFERIADGESCAAVSADLARRGVPPPGKEWIKGRVHDMIKSRHSVGEWIAHRKTRTAVSVPAIVTEELWQRAQRALVGGRTRGLRRTRHVYLLEQLAVCGACGAPMRILSTNVTRGRWVRASAYRCARRPAGGGCSAPYVKTADADERAWAAVCSILDDRDLPAELAAVRRERVADTRDWEADVAGYRAHLDRLDKVAAALLVRFRRGTVTEDELDSELAGVNRERAAIRAQLAAAERARGSIAGARDRLLEATAMIEQLRERMATATPEERRAIATTLIDPGGVTFNGRALRIEMFVDRPADSALVDAAS